MAYRRDKVIFQLFGLAQILRHLVDGGAQAADLVVFIVRFGQAGAQIAPGNAGGDVLHLAQRVDDGAHKEQPRPEAEAQDHGDQRQADHRVLGQSIVHQFQAGGHAQRGHVLGGVGGEHGDGQHPFPGGGGIDAPGGTARLHGGVQFCAPIPFPVGGQVAAGGGDQPAVRVQQHEFKFVLGVELLHHPAQRQAAGLGGGGGGGAHVHLQLAGNAGKPAENRLFHPAVVALAVGHQENRLGQDQRDQGDQKAAGEPAFCDTVHGSLLSGKGSAGRGQPFQR